MNKYSQQTAEHQVNGNKNKEKFIRTNWKIKARECRIVENGKAPYIMTTRDAVEYARSQGLDLVEIGFDYKSGVSTCRICDYGKYQYEQKQKAKLMKKQAKANQSELKCLQMSLTTDTADLNRMITHAKEFLDAGDRVKIALRFRGRRELSNLDLGKSIMMKVLDNFKDIAVLDSAPVLNNKELSCVIRRNSIKQ